MSKDFISEVSDSVIAHMNEDHASANLDYARGLGGIADAVSASLTAIRGEGISLLVETPQESKEIFIAFPQILLSAEEIRPALIRLLQVARESLRKG
ncbi:MAG: DUF2470 domain-containing protein [Arenicellales bacterium]